MVEMARGMGARTPDEIRCALEIVAAAIAGGLATDS
jgi:hypothetical protein